MKGRRRNVHQRILDKADKRGQSVIITCNVDTGLQQFMRIIDLGHIRLVKYDKNGGTIDKDINEGPVLTDGKANAEGNVSDGIHPSIDSTAKEFMNTIV